MSMHRVPRKHSVQGLFVALELLDQPQRIGRLLQVPVDEGVLVEELEDFLCACDGGACLSCYFSGYSSRLSHMYWNVLNVLKLH
jgi:hypothetical protein